jgi:hypothetical protein
MNALTAHLLWMWVWFAVGVVLYWAKRAYYSITGPNPLATGYLQFFQRAFVPLMVRAAIDSMIFWMCFTPQLLSGGLTYIGWANFGWVVSIVTKFAPCAFFFGHTVDSIVDLAISKVPFFSGFLPQMPAPLQPVVSQNPMSKSAQPSNGTTL